MEYISHARTPEELKREFCGDIYRRIAALDAYAKMVAKGAAERTRIERAISELKDILDYWMVLKIERPKTKRELARAERGEKLVQELKL